MCLVGSSLKDRIVLDPIGSADSEIKFLKKIVQRQFLKFVFQISHPKIQVLNTQQDAREGRR